MFWPNNNPCVTIWTIFAFLFHPTLYLHIRYIEIQDWTKMNSFSDRWIFTRYFHEGFCIYFGNWCAAHTNVGVMPGYRNILLARRTTRMSLPFTYRFNSTIFKYAVGISAELIWFIGCNVSHWMNASKILFLNIHW